jgi:membrane-bound inhibitor of C-type lysozyme
MRRRSICAVLAAIGIAGLSIAANAQRFTAYECNDGTQFQAAVIDRDKMAYLQLDGHSYQLPKRIAYTGDRYAKAGVTYWVRGNGRVTVKRAGKVSECFSVTAPGRG